MRLIYMPSNALHMIGGGDFSLSAVPRLNLRGGQRRRLRRLLHRGGGGGVCHQVRGESINNETKGVITMTNIVIIVTNTQYDAPTVVTISSSR